MPLYNLVIIDLVQIFIYPHTVFQKKKIIKEKNDKKSLCEKKNREAVFEHRQPSTTSIRLRSENLS